MDIYYKYSDYLKNKFNEKVYKLPINLPITCPNRNGCISFGGCTYCGEEAAGFECLPSSLSVKEQILKNKEYIEKKYKAKKFIAYFQNYTNTFLPLEDFKKYISEVNLLHKTEGIGAGILQSDTSPGKLFHPIHATGQSLVP